MRLADLPSFEKPHTHGLPCKMAWARSASTNQPSAIAVSGADGILCKRSKLKLASVSNIQPAFPSRLR